MSVGAAEALGLRELLTDTLVCRQQYDSAVAVKQPWELQHAKALAA